MRAYVRLRCPVEPGHGPLLDWPTERWGFFCPHEDHRGNGRFFTTVEAEAVSRPAIEPTPGGAPRGIGSTADRATGHVGQTGAMA